MSDPSFTVYVDESGDEGFLFKPDGTGTSHWFVLSAVVIRRTNDAMLVSCLKEVRHLLDRPPISTLHFVRLKHDQRVAFIRRVAALPLRIVSVVLHKPSIREPEKFQNKPYLLYRYATRLLLERVSWLCRDHRKEGEGDGRADVVFSKRSNMSYQEIQDYLKLLLQEAGSESPHVQLSPSVIDPQLIRAVDHEKLAGLQVADAVASGLFCALKRNRYGDTEPAYANLLKPRLYRHKGSLFGYGIKLWPADLEDLKKKAPEVLNLEGL